MNYSDKYKFIVLTPPRQATRSLSGIFQKLDTKNDFESSFTHKLEIPDGKEDYTIISSIRNPYKRYLSIYRWQSIFSLENLHETTMNHMHSYDTLMEIDKQYGVDYWVDTENITEDLLKIPFVSDNMELIKEPFKTLSSNGYQKEGKLEGVITQEIADEIYERCKIIFDKFGYKKDSWK